MYDILFPPVFIDKKGLQQAGGRVVTPNNAPGSTWKTNITETANVKT
jgi:hypothetical protein